MLAVVDVDLDLDLDLDVDEVETDDDDGETALACQARRNDCVGVKAKFLKRRFLSPRQHICFCLSTQSGPAGHRLYLLSIQGDHKRGRLAVRRTLDDDIHPLARIEDAHRRSRRGVGHGASTIDCEDAHRGRVAGNGQREAGKGAVVLLSQQSSERETSSSFAESRVMRTPC